MANFNKVILAGNLTRDPQLSYLPSGTPACEFGMAINRKWRAQNGDMKEEVCFVDLRCYGKQAEVINQYFTKGKPILVEGRLKYDQWEGKDGARKSRLTVAVDRFEFIGAPSGERGGGGGDRGGYRQASAPVQSRGSTYSATPGGADEMPPMEEAESGGNPDDPPF
jgi:single-strand DNA-binding protein